MIVEERMERSLKRNELIITVDEYEVNPGYQERMLLENDTQGLCPLRTLCVDEMKHYCYEMSNHETLKVLGEKEALSYEFIKRFLIQVANCFKTLDKYMIDESKILFDPEYIFVHINSKNVMMVFFPYKKEGIMDFVSLTEYLITVVDQDDERAVWVAYALERDAKMENFSFLAFLNMIQEYEVNTMSTQETEVIESLEKKEEAPERAYIGRVPVFHYVRLGSGLAIACLYFLSAYLISQIYNYEYQKSMIILIALLIVTFVLLLGNVIGIVREKNQEIEVEEYT